MSLNLRMSVAVVLTVLVGYLVNHGPKMAASFFGPATAAVLLLLWVMIISVVVQRGLHLPNLDLRAFTGPYVHLTLGGFARILALMTGIEIFANLVAAYEGTAKEKSRKAFGSLVIIMGTTVGTMLVVGPAILDLADTTSSDSADRRLEVPAQPLQKDPGAAGRFRDRRAVSAVRQSAGSALRLGSRPALHSGRRGRCGAQGYSGGLRRGSRQATHQRGGYRHDERRRIGPREDDPRGGRERGSEVEQGP